jgi:hypothetical protein
MAVLEHDTVASPDELTPACAWRVAAGIEVTDAVLEWAPDVFALTDVVLARGEVFRRPCRSWIGATADPPTGLARSAGRRGPALLPPARAGRSRPGRRESLRAPAHPSRQARAAIRFSAGLPSARLAQAFRRHPGPSAARCTTWERTRALHGRHGTAQDARPREPLPTQDRQTP